MAARFSHGAHDYLFLSLRLVDYGTISEAVDEHFETLWIDAPEPVTHRLRLRMCVAFDPILSLRAWLEALICGVQKAAWFWDGEGPYYE